MLRDRLKINWNTSSNTGPNCENWDDTSASKIIFNTIMWLYRGPYTGSDNHCNTLSKVRQIQSSKFNN